MNCDNLVYDVIKEHVECSFEFLEDRLKCYHRSTIQNAVGRLLKKKLIYVCGKKGNSKIFRIREG